MIFLETRLHNKYYRIKLIITTRFYSFTDGNIPLVCDYEFIGNLFTDVVTDRIRPSASHAQP